jgi:hypothetical protein
MNTVSDVQLATMTSGGHHATYLESSLQSPKRCPARSGRIAGLRLFAHRYGNFERRRAGRLGQAQAGAAGRFAAAQARHGGCRRNHERAPRCHAHGRFRTGCRARHAYHPAFPSGRHRGPPSEWDHDTAGTMPSACPPGTEPGALLYRSRENSPYFGTQNANSPPIGNTFEEPMGDGGRWGRADDRASRARKAAPPTDADKDSPRRQDAVSS